MKVIILMVSSSYAKMAEMNLNEIWYKFNFLGINYIYFKIIKERERRVIVISGSLIWSKTLMELIFNPCGEFRWSPEGPVSQIHSPHLLVGAPGIYQIF